MAEAFHNGTTAPDTAACALTPVHTEPLLMPAHTRGVDVLGGSGPTEEPLRASQPTLTPSVRRRSGLSLEASLGPAAAAVQLGALQLSALCAASIPIQTC